MPADLDGFVIKGVPAAAWLHIFGLYDLACGGATRNGSDFLRAARLKNARLAEAVGFEPTVRYERTPAFKTGAINHSATLPCLVSGKESRVQVEGEITDWTDLAAAALSLSSIKLAPRARLERATLALTVRRSAI